MAYISFQPKDYFNTLLWTGDGASSKSLTGTNFEPNWTWIKRRSDAQAHSITDSVRGVTKSLRSDSTAAEDTNNANGYVTSFDSDGFTVAKGSDPSRTNTSGATYVGWNWKASNTTAVSNKDGIITSTVSANTTSGFSIVKYTGTGANATVGTGLGVAPKIVLVKDLSASASWRMYTEMTGNQSQLALDQTSAADSGNTTMWNSTSPTNTTFSIGTHPNVNTSSNNYIAYCFAEKKGFSAMNSYVGNGSADGSFIYTGMKPSMVIIKLYTTGAENWRIFDNKRIGYNPNNYKLYPSGSFAEGTSDLIDIYSNGFKPRSNSVEFNGSGNGYIYIAFAESSIVSSNGVPAVAR
jgi:hypothetical protein